MGTRKTKRKPDGDRRRGSQRKSSVAQKPASLPSLQWRHVLLAIFGALLTLNVLLPGDGVTVAMGSGVPHVMLWLMLTVVWLLSCVMRRELKLRVAAADIWFVLFVALHTASAMWAVRGGAARPAINVMWEIIGIGLVYFLARQWLDSQREMRAVVVLMIALAVVLSGYGIYQVAYDLPQARAAYEADPPRMLQLALGTPYPSPAARQQFEDRLYSNEPYGTFNLANSLAALLATWLTVAVGVGALVWQRSRKLNAELVGMLATVTLLTTCLMWTKSRSAILSFLCGAVLISVLARYGDIAKRRKTFAWAFATMIAVASAVSIAMQWPLPMTDGARTSMRFRLEYWQSTLAMVRDMPLLGCGPGNYQATYTAYKLPQAKETVADPHNFLFEIWATAGTPALLCLLAAIGVFLMAAFFARRNTTSGPVKVGADRSADADRSSSAAAARMLLLGGLAGIPAAAAVAAMYAPVIESTWTLMLAAVGLCLAGAVIVLWRGWIDGGHMAIEIPAIGAVVLLIDLLAAGGIANHGLASSLWLLVALTLNVSASDYDDDRRIDVPRNMVLGILLLVLISAFLCQMTANGPVINSRRAQHAALMAELNGQLDEAQQKYEIAAAADPLAAEPHQRLTRIAFRRWTAALADGSAVPAAEQQQLRGEFDASVREWLQRTPRSSMTRRVAGDMYLRAYRVSEDDELLKLAVSYYQRAIQRHPGSNILHAQLAWAHYLSSDTDAAATAAREALRLDALTPHADAKLNSPQQSLAGRVTEDPPLSELMQRIGGGKVSEN